MSVINKMLHDLEKRRGQKTRQVPVIDTMMMRQTGMTGAKIIFVAAVVVLLTGIVGAGLFLLPTLSAEKTLARKDLVDQAASHTPAEQQPKITISPMTVKEESKFVPENFVKTAAFSTPVGTPVHAVLAEMTLMAKDGVARLILTFTRPPEYSLVQSGRQNVPLIMSFNETTMDEHLEIPEVTGSVLERIHLQPRQAHVLLLIDFAAGSRLESLTRVENSESKYSLVMEFMQEIQPAKPIGEQPIPIVPEKTGDVTNRSTMAGTAPGEGNAVGQREQNKIVLAKKKRLPSRDKQSYQTGLEQLRRGALEAAAKSFSQALAINPAHPMARLRLIATLQQLKQPGQAAVQMRQGLEILPKNRLLRKEYARYLLHNKQYGTGIALLRQVPVPSVADDAEYHALLAALLQESGQYDEAAEVYARLLRIRPENGIWWLGFAVSMDQSGNFEQARNAYQRALNLSELDSGTREYVKSRLEAL